MSSINKDSLLNTGQFIGGDINEDNDETVALGKGSVAANDSTVNAATAPFAVSNFGGEVNQAQGPGSQVVSHSGIGQQAFNSDGAVLGQGGSLSGVNTGVNTGVNAGGNVDRTIVGDHNAQANQDHVSDSALSFGGDANNVSDNIGFGSNFNAGGSQQSFTGNELHDSTLAGHDGLNAAHHDTNLSFREDNLTNIENSEDVNTSQHGTSVADQSDFFQKFDDHHVNVEDDHSVDHDFFDN